MREIRDAVASDAAALAGIFFRAVHEGAAAQYSEAERRAWCPALPDADMFWHRLGGQTVLIALEGDGPAGFMTLTPDGVLDMAFVHPEKRGSGLAGELLSVLENRALSAGLGKLTARASHLARPFLRRNGWYEVGAVTVQRAGVAIEATNMARDLPVPARLTKK